MDRWSRRQFVQGVGLTGLGLLAGCGTLPFQGQAQPPPQQLAKAPRIGALWPIAEDTTNPYLQSLQQGLRELGYIDGQNVTFEWRFTDGQVDRAAALAAELVRLPVDVIVAPGTPTALVAKQTTATTPIVVPISVDPVGNGLVASFARPGGNITGLSANLAELSGKRLELLKETLPGLMRVAVLWNPANPDPATQWREMQSAATVLGLQLRSLEARTPDEIENALETAGAERVDALFVLGDPLTFELRARISELVTKHRLPTMYDQKPFVYAGGLMSYGPNVVEQFRRAATYVDKILKGAAPADLPVEQPREFDFVINLKTAQALGLTIPEHVLLQATEVIQ